MSYNKNTSWNMRKINVIFKNKFKNKNKKYMKIGSPMRKIYGL